MFHLLFYWLFIGLFYFAHESRPFVRLFLAVNKQIVHLHVSYMICYWPPVCWVIVCKEPGCPRCQRGSEFKNVACAVATPEYRRQTSCHVTCDQIRQEVQDLQVVLVKVTEKSRGPVLRAGVGGSLKVVREGQDERSGHQLADHALS